MQLRPEAACETRFASRDFFDNHFDKQDTRQVPVISYTCRFYFLFVNTKPIVSTPTSDMPHVTQILFFMAGEKAEEQ